MKKYVILNFESISDYLDSLNQLSKLKIKIYDSITQNSEKEILNKSNQLRKKTRVISIFALIGAIIGGLMSFYFQFWTEIINYPINTGGKPFYALPASIPLIFLVSILFSAIFTFVGFLILSHLPAWNLEANIEEMTSIYKNKNELFSIILKLNKNEIDILRKEFNSEKFKIID